jgi:metallo-beta-lactamase class B
MVADYRATFAYIRGLRADVFLAPHANFFNLHGKRTRQIAGDSNAFVNPGELQAFNAQSERDFDAELARESAASQ